MLRALLRELGWTQVRFAARCGVSRQTVGAWVSGRVEVMPIVIEYLELLLELRGKVGRPVGGIGRSDAQ